MQITNKPSVAPDTASNPAVRADNAGTPTATPHAPPSSGSSLSLLAYSLVPSFELLSLDAALSQVPPVRPDVLAQTILRLASGDLHDGSALDQTASAMLGG
jgi:hypothetical protein